MAHRERALNLIRIAERYEEPDILACEYVSVSDPDSEPLWAPAVPILRRSGGMLMALPQELLSDQDLDLFDASDSHEFGQHQLCEIRSRGDRSAFLTVLIIDVTNACLCLWPRWRSVTPREFVSFQPVVGTPLDINGMGPLPESAHLVDSARAFLADVIQDGPAMGYVSAASGVDRAAAEETPHEDAAEDIDTGARALPGSAPIATARVQTLPPPPWPPTPPPWPPPPIRPPLSLPLWMLG